MTPENFPSSLGTVLIVDRNLPSSAELRNIFADEQVTSININGANEALEFLGRVNDITVVVLDLDTVGEAMLSTFMMVKKFHCRKHFIEFVVTSSNTNLKKMAVEGSDLLIKPYSGATLKETVLNALDAISDRINSYTNTDYTLKSGPSIWRAHATRQVRQTQQALRF
jgi:DNA-binding LytR/AlgR family response regulator